MKDKITIEEASEMLQMLYNTCRSIILAYGAFKVSHKHYNAKSVKKAIELYKKDKAKIKGLHRVILSKEEKKKYKVVKHRFKHHNKYLYYATEKVYRQIIKSRGKEKKYGKKRIDKDEEVIKKCMINYFKAKYEQTNIEKVKGKQNEVIMQNKGIIRLVWSKDFNIVEKFKGSTLMQMFYEDEFIKRWSK